MSMTVPMYGFGGGGGGSVLNFDVKDFRTEAELLASAGKENRIGVVTPVPMTNWIFSATQPAEPVEGVVCFSTGTSSTVEFNALKKNGIQVYPLSAKQYVSGAWANVTAMRYQNGKWVNWLRPFLFKDGQVVNGNIVVKSGAILEIRENNLYFYGKSAHRAGFDFDLMNFTDHNAVKFNIVGITNKITFGFVTTTAELTGTSSFTAMQTISRTGWNTIDIPSGMTHAYFAIADAGQCDCLISEIEVI